MPGTDAAELARQKAEQIAAAESLRVEVASQRAAQAAAAESARAAAAEVAKQELARQKAEQTAAAEAVKLEVAEMMADIRAKDDEMISNVAQRFEIFDPFRANCLISARMMNARLWS